MKIFENFVGLYSLSKTIPFELRPVFTKEFKTEEEREQALQKFWSTFKDNQSYKDDDQRAKSYPIVKALMDHFHKKIIDESLNEFSYAGWEKLADAYKKRNKKSNEYRALQGKARESIVSALEAHKLFSYVASMPDLVKKQLKEEIEDDVFLATFRASNATLFADNLLNNNEDVDTMPAEKYRNKLSEHISIFSRFPGSYFTKYKKNRENMYSPKAQDSAVSNRLVNENFETFVKNVAVYKRLVDLCPEALQLIEKGLKEKLQGKTFAEVFSYDYYNQCLTQSGIELYNYLIGGDTSIHTGILGINDVGNKYLQQHPDSKVRLKDLKMGKLFKQILSDKQLPEFIRKKFASKEDMKVAVSSFLKSMQEGGMNDVLSVMNSLKDDGTNYDQIYVTGKWLSILSYNVFGNSQTISYQLREDTVNANTKKGKSKLNKEIEEWVEKKIFNLEEVCAAANHIEDGKASHIYTLLVNLTSQKKKYSKDENDDISTDWEDYDLWKECKGLITELEKSKEDEYEDKLKEVLDMFLRIFHIVSILRLGNKESLVEKDNFYTQYNQLFAHNEETEVIKLCDIVPLYDAVRDFINTNKLSNDDKTRLNFDSANLTKKWERAFIVQKSNNYYLGIKVYNEDTYKLTKDKKYSQLKITKEEEKGLFEHGDCVVVENKLLPMGPDNLYRMFIYSRTKTKPYRVCSSVYKYDLPLDSIRKKFDKYYSYENDKTKKAKFLARNKDFIPQLIEYFKFGMLKHDSLKPFINMVKDNWKDSSEYTSIREFSNDVEDFTYYLRKRDANFEVLRNLQEKGKIIMFQIYNKDYSESASLNSNKNLHTLYWEEIFNERNLQNIVFKLSNEGAEIFFRNKKEQKETIHAKGSWLVNKRFKDGSSIPEKLYIQYSNPCNIKEDGSYIESQLSSEAIANLDRVAKPKLAKHDIVKNKRYHEDKCMLHVPIEINFGKPKVNSERIKSFNAKFNEDTLTKLRENRDELKIIGVDRGERNLIYVTMINQKGEIEYSRSFNTVDNVGADGVNRPFDYHEKLDQIEGERAEARKNWKKQKKIKDTKKGYIGQVVHEITKLMVNNTAIIVLEDLNFGFKRGRFGVEKQVYQEFEKELINKLNYLALKSGSPSENYANIHNGLQLTAPFSSFKNLGKQSGWLFYVPAAYTSKIDPVTGFANLFNMKEADRNPKEFFMNFNRIEFSGGVFKFEFDYGKDAIHTVSESHLNVWTVTSHGGRLVYDPINKKTEQIEDLTKKIKEKVFGKYHIDFSNLSIETLKAIDNDKFFKTLLRYFKLILQMRNSNVDNDYIISPVDAACPFDTRNEAAKGKSHDGSWISNLPADADANGAYHIALKGLYLLLNNFPMEIDEETGHEYLKYITNAEWLEFVQKHDYRNE